MKFQSDDGIYERSNVESKVILGIYVDDLIIVSKDLVKVDKVKQMLKSQFEMSDLGEVSYLLGIQIERGQDGSIHMQQQKYANKVLKKFSMLGCKLSNVPLPTGTKLSAMLESEEQMSLKEFLNREVVGSLMYLVATTRPDIATAVSKVSQFLANPSKEH